MEIILASQSPRRAELLGRTIKDFRVVVSEVSEELPEGISPGDAVEMLCLRKAEAVASSNPDALVIGSDTVVALGDKILGKPESADHAAEILRELSGREHVVYTGVAICAGGKSESFISSTAVKFYELSEELISAYVADGEPMDKAGAYGIQGLGGLLVEGIKGDYFTVMGLPMAELYRVLKTYPVELKI